MSFELTNELALAAEFQSVICLRNRCACGLAAAEPSDHSVVLMIFMSLNQLRGLFWNAADSARARVLRTSATK